MFEQYFGLDIKRMGYFLGLAAAAAVMVTLIYGLVFGFDRWSGEMQRASDLMMAATGAAPVPADTAPAASGQYVCPRDGAVGLPQFDGAGTPFCPLDGQAMNFHSIPSGNLNPGGG